MKPLTTRIIEGILGEQNPKLPGGRGIDGRVDSETSTIDVITLNVGADEEM